MILVSIQDLYGGSPQEAEDRYVQIIKEVEKFEYPPKLCWMAYNGYGLALLETGEKINAFTILLRAIEEARKLAPREVKESTLNLARAYMETRRYFQAIEQYKAALSIEPKNSDISRDLASAYRQAQLYDDAIVILEKIIAENPNYKDAYKNLGNVYLNKREYDKALALYEKYAGLTTDRNEIAQNFLNVGFIYYDQKEYEKALKLYNRALEITPDNPLVYIDIGWALLSLGRYQESITAFEKGLSLNPEKQIREYAKQGLKEAKSKNK
jgi:tetratricopeptide (TPR) repeat protein